MSCGQRVSTLCAIARPLLFASHPNNNYLELPVECSPVSPVSDGLRENLAKTSHEDIVKLERRGADPGRALQAGLARHPAVQPRVDPPAHHTNIRF